jgi:hypothetical protein
MTLTPFPGMEWDLMGLSPEKIPRGYMQIYSSQTGVGSIYRRDSEREGDIRGGGKIFTSSLNFCRKGTGADGEMRPHPPPTLFTS